MHSLNPPVCHGDLKPVRCTMTSLVGAAIFPEVLTAIFQENVLLTEDGCAVICDLGLAREQNGLPSGLTTSKGLKCTQLYISPEVLRDQRALDIASDIWCDTTLASKTPFANGLMRRAWGCVVAEVCG